MNKITASALGAIITGLVILGGVSIFDKDVYYCEDSGIVMKCDSLSKYYFLPNGKCNNAELGNKLCRSGWLEVENDILVGNETNLTEIIEPEKIIEPKEIIEKPKVRKWLCNQEKCVEFS